MFRKFVVSRILPGMEEYSLNENDLLRATLSSVTESGHCTFTCEELSSEDYNLLTHNASEIDVDYIMLKEECSTMLSKPQISEFFGDFRAEFFTHSVKAGIYSASVKEVLTFGRIGEYKIGTLYTTRSRAEIIDDEEIEAANIVGNNQYSEDFEECGMTRNDIESRLISISRLTNGQMPFERMREYLLQFFNGFTLVIFKYGQKIPLSVIKPKLIDIFQQASIPIEVALGIQYRLNEQFLSANITQDTMKFGFSNFLSNEMGNIRINVPAIAEIYCENAYRLCLYNTFQHFKKDIKLVLEKSPSVSSCSLSAFDASMKEIDTELRRIGTHITDSELRLELYFTIGNLKQLGESIAALKTLICKFAIVRKPMEDVTRIFRQRRKLLKALFSYAKDWTEINTFFFLTYFQKFKSFILSTERTTNVFLQNNCGMFLKENWFDVATKHPTRHFFEANTIVNIKGLLDSVFGDSKNASGVIVYYYILYYNKFLPYIEANREIVRKVAFTVGNAMLCNEKGNSAASATQHYNVTIGDIILVLLSKTKNVFYEGFLKQLQAVSTTNSLFRVELVQMLSRCKYQTCKNRNCYKLSEITDDSGSTVTWSEVTEFVTRQTYGQLVNSIQGNFNDGGNISGIENFQNNSVSESDKMKADKFYRVYRKKEHGFWEAHFLKNTPKEDHWDFRVTQDVFLSFLFTTYAVDLKDVNSRLEKAINLFNSFNDFCRFIYASAFKFYVPYGKSTPKSLTKFFQNLISVKRYQSKTHEFGLTFCRLAYFSGRFDRRYEKEGLYLPLPVRMDLKSRIGLMPHRMLNETTTISFSSNISSCLSMNNYNDPLDKIFGVNITDSEPEMEIFLENQRRYEDNFVNPLQNDNNVSSIRGNGINDILYSETSLFSEFDYPSLNPSSKKLKKHPYQTKIRDLFSFNDTMSIDKNDQMKNDIVSKELIEELDVLKDSTENIQAEITSLNEFNERLLSIFRNSSDTEFIELIISKGITKELIRESTEDELQEVLKRFCKMSNIMAKCTAQTLKVEFN